jgi:hypothetical protein
MSLNENEQLLVEAIKSMLQHDSKLGLSIHDKPKDEAEAYNAERGLEYLHGNIEQMFHLKAAELDLADSICQGFHKVHSYKYIDDPTFKTALEKELVAQAVPAHERAQAAKFVDDIIDELKEDQEWAEKDYGLNPHMADLHDVSRPEQPMDFDIIDREGYNDKNITSKRGEASPGMTPNTDDL